jgi:hypothetical protein
MLRILDPSLPVKRRIRQVVGPHGLREWTVRRASELRGEMQTEARLLHFLRAKANRQRR